MLVTELSLRGIIITLAGNDLKLRGPAGVLIDADVDNLRDHKQDILRLLRLVEGLPIDDAAARVMAMEEVDPADVPECSACGRLCDVETLVGAWRCSVCDSDAETRRERTDRILGQVASIRGRDAVRVRR